MNLSTWDGIVLIILAGCLYGILSYFMRMFVLWRVGVAAIQRMEKVECEKEWRKLLEVLTKEDK